MAKYFAIFLLAIFGGDLCTAQIKFQNSDSKSTQPGAGVKFSGGSSGVSAGAPKISADAANAGKPGAGGDKDSASPQARFFPGIGGIGSGFGNPQFGGIGSGFGNPQFSGIGSGFGNPQLGSLFNPCARCNFNDVRQANECCMKGEPQCCRFVTGFGSSFGQPGASHGFGRPGIGRPGIGSQGFGSQGFGRPGIGRPGIGRPGIGRPGIGRPGFPGHGIGSVGFPQGHAQGFGITGFVSPSGFGPGSQGFVSGPQGFLPGSQTFRPGSGAFVGGGSPFAGRPNTNQKFGFCPKPNFIAEALGLRKLDDKEAGKPAAGAGAKSKVKRQAQSAGKPKVEDPKSPSTRAFNNPFCRDSCFTDFDCPGNLKCCINSQECKFCTHPVNL